MITTRFWMVAAVIGITAAIGCGNDSGDQPTSGSGSSSTPATAAAPAGEAVSPTKAPSAPSANAENEGGHAPVSFDAPPPVGTRAHCPVMDNDFVVTEDTQSSVYNGRHYVFCCPACKPRFDANPQQFLGAAASDS